MTRETHPHHQQQLPFAQILDELKVHPHYIRAYGQEPNQVAFLALQVGDLLPEISVTHGIRLFRMTPRVDDNGVITGIHNDTFVAHACTDIEEDHIQRFYQLEYASSHRSPAMAELAWIRRGVPGSDNTISWDPEDMPVSQIQLVAAHLKHLGYPLVVDVPATIESYATGIITAGPYIGQPIEQAVPQHVFALAPGILPHEPEAGFPLCREEKEYRPYMTDMLISDPKTFSGDTSLPNKQSTEQPLDHVNTPMDKTQYLPFSHTHARVVVAQFLDETYKFVLMRRNKNISPKEVVFHLHRIIDQVGRGWTNFAKRDPEILSYVRFIKDCIPEVAPLLFAEKGAAHSSRVADCRQEHMRITGKF